MKVLYTVNNYQLGAKVKSTPTDKIISQTRTDKTHTEIIYQFENIRQKESCDKILAKNGKILEEERKHKCAVTGGICSYETDAEGCKPCKECEIGKEFLKDYVPLHDEI